MNLTPHHLTDLTNIAIEAARKAGTYISETRPTEIRHKQGGDNLASQVVTEVDRQSQEIILEILAPTLSAYDLALLAEESADDGRRLEKDYFWCIDPVDGTLPFIEGLPGYAVSIALVSREGIPQIGVVFDPVEQTLYHAVRGQGAFRNAKRWEIRSPGLQLQLITDRSEVEAVQYPLVIEALEKIAADRGLQGLETTIHGGGVMNALWVLERAPACYFKFPKPGMSGGCLWDFSATACIFQEAGAVASDIHGNALDLNRADSTLMNHCGTLFASDADLAGCIRKLYKTLRAGGDE